VSWGASAAIYKLRRYDELPVAIRLTGAGSTPYS
jgi:hypothetical protein